MSGKGSGRRPAAISDAQYQERWDLIFGKEAQITSPFDAVVTDAQEIRETFEKMEDEDE